MDKWLQDFILTFVPLFIVIDAFGNLPFVITLSEGLSQRERRKMIHISVITASLVGLAFLFLGRFILGILGITVGDFTIGGGLVLLVLSIQYMASGQTVEAAKEEMMGAVPIGTPLTVGPASITALLLLAGQFPIYIVLLAFALNMAIVWAVFQSGGVISRVLGLGGLKAFSKVLSLLLTAFAVSLIIRGLELSGIIKGG